MMTGVAPLPVHRQIALNDVTLHVACWLTDKPPLLLLPAMTQTWDTWLPVVPTLAAHFAVVAVDLRGHGQSEHPPAGYRLAEYAADVVELTRALGWNCPVVIGHSLGGTVAQVAETAFPGWARRIVIEDSPLQLAQHDRRVVLLARAYLRMYHRPFAESAAHFRRVHPDWNATQVDEAAHASRATAPAVLEEYLAHEMLTLDTTLHGMYCPVLLVHGDTASGGFVDDETVRMYLDHLPDGRAVQVAGAGHSLHARKPAEFLAAVLPFLLEP